jgi:hypothetical protein
MKLRQARTCCLFHVLNTDPWLFLGFVHDMRSEREVVASSSAGGGSNGGRYDAQDTRWSSDVADPGENFKFQPLVGAGCNTPGTPWPTLLPLAAL